ncbi:winged helix-turn-helix domain-containing protein [Granulosicoccus antarcticus]|uniref:Transcriptional regulator HilA n=1 Tax=Granulosicoccus antarcticus IMCC3135 TaxID=1192854 RepID=A0A2Z2NX20_9GAMM|nr:winged helix-turn-helix domain-containing protein [Granulosicoccus antarcticus]ASJ75783.1 Transcriptional regulator HilA [Granulosicoccus antarcticus IMCC3135]
MNASTTSIGQYTLNRRLGCLEDGRGNAQHLRPKSYRVLELLIERRGTLVSKDDLAAGAWNDLTVTDESLSQCISDIRRVLGKEDAKLLRTVPRRGYVLKAQETHADSPESSAWGIRVGTVVLSMAAAALAILFLSGSPEHEATGAAIEDSVASVGVRLPTSGSQDWRERDANDELRAKLNEILASDPQDADAWAELGQTYWLEVKYSAWGGGRRELGQSLGALERSLILGGGAVAYRVLAEVRLDAPFKDARSLVDALAAAQAAVLLAPTDPDGLAILADALLANGYAEEAVPLIEQAIAAVAAPPDRYREIAGLIYLVEGEPAKAVEEFGRLHGAGTFSGMRDYKGWFLAASLAHAGRIEEASAVIRQAQISRPERTLDGVAVSLDSLDGQKILELVLEGLRLAGMPG